MEEKTNKRKGSKTHNLKTPSRSDFFRLFFNIKIKKPRDRIVELWGNWPDNAEKASIDIIDKGNHTCLILASDDGGLKEKDIERLMGSLIKNDHIDNGHSEHGFGLRGSFMGFYYDEFDETVKEKKSYITDGHTCISFDWDNILNDNEGIEEYNEYDTKQINIKYKSHLEQVISKSTKFSKMVIIVSQENIDEYKEEIENTLKMVWSNKIIENNMKIWYNGNLVKFEQKDNLVGQDKAIFKVYNCKYKTNGQKKTRYELEFSDGNKKMYIGDKRYNEEKFSKNKINNKKGPKINITEIDEEYIENKFTEHVLVNEFKINIKPLTVEERPYLQKLYGLDSVRDLCGLLFLKKGVLLSCAIHRPNGIGGDGHHTDKDKQIIVTLTVDNKNNDYVTTNPQKNIPPEFKNQILEWYFKNLFAILNKIYFPRPTKPSKPTQLTDNDNKKDDDSFDEYKSSDGKEVDEDDCDDNETETETEIDTDTDSNESEDENDDEPNLNHEQNDNSTSETKREINQQNETGLKEGRFYIARPKNSEDWKDEYGNKIYKFGITGNIDVYERLKQYNSYNPTKKMEALLNVYMDVNFKVTEKKIRKKLLKLNYLYNSNTSKSEYFSEKHLPIVKTILNEQKCPAWKIEIDKLNIFEQQKQKE